MTFKLTVVYQGRTLDRYEFDDADEITVGRHEDCEVRIDNNKGISRRHCEIKFRDSAHVLHDLGSSNGTYVNGKKIKQHTLNNGDVFSVAGFKIKYEGQTIVTHKAPEKPMGLADLTMNVNPKSFRELVVTGGSSGRSNKIHGHIVMNDDVKTTILLHKSVLTIGKDPKADLKIESAFAPRLAALVVRDQREFWVLDVSPKGNAVTINGEDTRAQTLTNGDVVVISGGKAQFEYRYGLPQVQSLDDLDIGAPTNSWSRRDAGFLD